MKISLFAGAVCLALASCGQQAEVATSYDIIPNPQQITVCQDAPFRLDKRTRILYSQADSLLEHNAAFLSEYIAQATGYRLETAPLEAGADVEGAIVLNLNDSIADKEGYVLHVSPGKITIDGQTANGVFYGVQALRKSIPAQAPDNAILLPAATIQDAPRFAYRGMHLDVCRHFFPVEFVKRYIDLLALHNMNVFHWHLTDDQGWRIEIKKYPKLTEVGSMRSRTVIGRNSGEYDNTPHGGYYTQEQAREIVEYARQRYITVIPEVDLPGHMLAALAAYPELGCTGGPYEVCPEWGVFEDVLCIGNDNTLLFLEGVMDEITDIFPSEYIHIGGDEVPRTRWEQCPKCQKRIRDEHLKSDKEHSAEDRLQSYCMKRMADYLAAKGRKVIGWDEILEGDIPADATVMSWRGSAGGIEAARMGHDVVMVPNNYCYFDYYQSLDTEHEPFAIGGYVPVDHVYSFEPTASLTDEQKKHILGAQANLWTEYIPTTEYAEYMVLPRMAALAEVQWTQPERKDYDDFLVRLNHLVRFYQRDGYNYAKHVFPADTTKVDVVR